MDEKILICDDHILFSTGLAELIKSAKNSVQVEVVNSSNQCVEFIKNKPIDVFICDLNIDQMDGFELIESLHFYLKSTKIIILSAYQEDYLIQKAKKMGVFAFLRKETTPAELIWVMERKVADGFYSQDPKKKENKFKDFDDKFINQFKLSKQELAIIRQIVKGKTSEEISQILFISTTTVSTHRRNINRKLEITNVGSLIKLVHENNLLA